MEYTEERLAEIISSVEEPDRKFMDAAEKRQAQLAKPPGSLGRLEDLSVLLCGIRRVSRPRVDNKFLLVFCADNGVTEEGVASAPRSVTLAQTVNLVRRKTGGSVLAKNIGCRLMVCDVGVDAEIHEPGVIGRKIARGTNNILHGPAMTRDMAVRAVLTGADLASDAAAEGADVIGIGEMGIGNTTTSSAVLSVLTSAAVKDVTGKGGGITEEAYLNKISVIEKAIDLNSPDRSDVVDVLSKVGGFDIAAMAGAFIGAAAARVPSIIDGFIAVVAALCAARLCPAAADYMIPSHASYEIGYRVAMDELGKRPIFDLGMRLGEGSGCPIAMSILDAACAVMNDMATFGEAGIDDEYLDPIRKIDAFTV
ncbi:MAG: nicotinate-nucleotide--dimethylbenzimidazole phosphoribosyltransferase [Clostridiales bacterium]|nr:nicotinate-nucleotide--dimethylbenzimidazole phosphoribosyltransferase [Clostridiales bacterium]